MFASPYFSDLLTEPSPAETCPQAERELPRPRRDGPIGPALAVLTWPGTTLRQLVGVLGAGILPNEATVRLWHVVPDAVEIDYAEASVPLVYLSDPKPSLSAQTVKPPILTP